MNANVQKLSVYLNGELVGKQKASVL